MPISTVDINKRLWETWQWPFQGNLSMLRNVSALLLILYIEYFNLFFWNVSRKSCLSVHPYMSVFCFCTRTMFTGPLPVLNPARIVSLSVCVYASFGMSHGFSLPDPFFPDPFFLESVASVCPGLVYRGTTFWTRAKSRKWHMVSGILDF